MRCSNITIPGAAEARKIKNPGLEMKMDKLLSETDSVKAKRGDIATAVVIPEGNKLTIKVPSAGELVLSLDMSSEYGNDWVVDTVGLTNEFKGKGLGVKMYLKAIEELLKKDALYMSSGGMTTESAMRVWRSLHRQSKEGRGSSIMAKDFPQLLGTFRVYKNEDEMKVLDNGKFETQYEQDLGDDAAYTVELYPAQYKERMARLGK